MEKITTKEWVLNVVVAIVIVGGIGFAIYSSVKAPEVDDSAFRNEFVTGCMTESNFTMCDCTFTELKKDMGLDGLLVMAVEYEQTGIMPTRAYKAVAKCADKY